MLVVLSAWPPCERGLKVPCALSLKEIPTKQFVVRQLANATACRLGAWKPGLSPTKATCLGTRMTRGSERVAGLWLRLSYVLARTLTDHPIQKT